MTTTGSGTVIGCGDEGPRGRRDLSPVVGTVSVTSIGNGQRPSRRSVQEDRCGRAVLGCTEAPVDHGRGGSGSGRVPVGGRRYIVPGMSRGARAVGVGSTAWGSVASMSFGPGGPVVPRAWSRTCCCR